MERGGSTTTPPTPICLANCWQNLTRFGGFCVYVGVFFNYLYKTLFLGVAGEEGIQQAGPGYGRGMEFVLIPSLGNIVSASQSVIRIKNEGSGKEIVSLLQRLISLNVK